LPVTRCSAPPAVSTSRNIASSGSGNNSGSGTEATSSPSDSRNWRC
jgi:hypothetical protein